MTNIDDLNELAKRRGFFFSANDSYGGLAGFYVYGPMGAALKSNIENSWRSKFVIGEGHFEISTPTISPPPVFKASGHIDGFNDLLITCLTCETSYRADHLLESQHALSQSSDISIQEFKKFLSTYSLTCPSCKNTLDDSTLQEFNLMFATKVGPGSQTPGYLRPETAQGIFVEFPRLSSYARGKLPFGVAQIGTSYRNEISPRKGLTRLREFTQAELELFIHPTDLGPTIAPTTTKLPLYSISQQESKGTLESVTAREAIDQNIISNRWLAYYLELSTDWYNSIGIDLNRFRYRQHMPNELAHYASDCWDAEVEIDGDWIEITGFAHRGNYDLSKHNTHSSDDFTMFIPSDEPQKKIQTNLNPDMGYFGPTFGKLAPEILSRIDEMAMSNSNIFDSPEINVDINGTIHSVLSKHLHPTTEETTINGEHILPHVIEPSFGIDRIIYSILTHTFHEDTIDGETRFLLSLPPSIAPTFVGIFPLLTRDNLDVIAQDMASNLRTSGFSVAHDESGSIGKRYRRQDEVGTPFCVTIDHQYFEDHTVTLRERNSATQIRVEANSIPTILESLRNGSSTFSDLG